MKETRYERQQTDQLNHFIEGNAFYEHTFTKRLSKSLRLIWSLSVSIMDMWPAYNSR